MKGIATKDSHLFSHLTRHQVLRSVSYVAHTFEVAVTGCAPS